MASQISMFAAGANGGGIGPLTSAPSRPLSEIVPAAPKLPEVKPAIVSKSLFENAVMLNLRISCLGTNRKVGTDAVQADGVDKSMLHISKDILESKKLKEITSEDGAISATIRKFSIPSLFKKGTYIVSLELVERVDGLLMRYLEKREVLVNDFLFEYESAKANAKVSLGPLYADSDYPSIERVRASFGVFWQWFTFGAPDQLADISPAFLKREKEKALGTMRDAVAESVALLQTELAKWVDWLVDRLTPGPDGKAKKFDGPTVVKLQEFLDLFAYRNFAADADLQGLVDKARSLVSGVSPDALRNGGSYRNSVREGFKQIKSSLDSMVVAAPARRVVLDDSLENI